MSEFYKEKRNLILKNYKYFGMKEKTICWGCRIGIIIIGIMLCYQLLELEKSRVIDFAFILLCGLVLCLVLYATKKEKCKEQLKNKKDAVLCFVKEAGINIETVDSLIEEIERYNKKASTFALWIAGLVATFTVFIATISVDFLMKIFDVYSSMTSTEELSELLEFLNQIVYVENGIWSYFLLSFLMLLLFLIEILVIYIVSVVVTFAKKQILIFLFDVKYELWIGYNN